MVSLPSDEEEEEEEYASDIQSERCESYSPSADVSESESSGRVGRAAAGASSSFSSSPPLAPARAALLPGVPHLVFWESKLEKREADFSGS